MSLKDAEDDSVLEEEKKSKFRLKLEEFSFQAPQFPLTLVTCNCTPVSKKRSIIVAENDSPTKSKKKRGYAPPETYAHLNYLTDCLGEYLDVLFCGINPGVLSATVGHHFAHPGNRFYRMLYGSGFTDQLVTPEEDSTLPARYNIGITDIVDRPSSCEDELSAEEMIDSVPTLLQKVAKYKPRFVCFIGKGMGQRVEKGFRREISGNGKPTSVQNTKEEPIRRTPSPRKKTTRQANVEDGKTSARDNGIGLRPFKVTHQGASSLVRETLFFVSHSSSGLATSMTLQEKVDLLKKLRELLVRHKSGTLDTSLLEEVPVLQTGTCL